MKICSLPACCPAPTVDYTNFDMAKLERDEAAHKAELKARLIAMGFNGKHTGKIYRDQVCDGYALYMLADKGAKSVLVHLPYGDAYQSRDAAYLPRKVILERIEADERIAALFAGR